MPDQRTITLGGQSIQIPRMGLGLAALGRPGYINLGHADDLNRNYDVKIMELHTHAVLDTAWSAGLRYFDAARSYGRAEAFLGSWLTACEIAPGDALIGSKWGYTYTANWQIEAEQHEVKEHSLAVLEGQWAESAGLLGPYLNLYQVHSATLSSGILTNNTALDRLAELRDSGLTVGLSLSGTRQSETLEAALTVQRGGEAVFGSVQATLNVLEDSVGPMLSAARNEGWVIIIKEAVANGRLTPRNYDPAFEESRRVLEGIADAHGAGIDAVALAAVLARPYVDVVLSGAATSSQLESNVKALDIALSDTELNQLEALRETPQVYWSKRSGLAWN